MKLEYLLTNLPVEVGNNVGDCEGDERPSEELSARGSFEKNRNRNLLRAD